MLGINPGHRWLWCVLAVPVYVLSSVALPCAALTCDAQSPESVGLRVLDLDVLRTPISAIETPQTAPVRELCEGVAE